MPPSIPMSETLPSTLETLQLILPPVPSLHGTKEPAPELHALMHHKYPKLELYGGLSRQRRKEPVTTQTPTAQPSTPSSNTLLSQTLLPLLLTSKQMLIRSRTTTPPLRLTQLTEKPGPTSSKDFTKLIWLNHTTELRTSTAQALLDRSPPPGSGPKLNTKSVDMSKTFTDQYLSTTPPQLALTVSTTSQPPLRMSHTTGQSPLLEPHPWLLSTPAFLVILSHTLQVTTQPVAT